MKGSNAFKETIKEYLDKRAEIDFLFAEHYKRENKNIDSCIKYILNKVKESELNGFDDDEIYSMAVHYYDEENIDEKYLNDMDNGRVVINHHTELTAEEKAEIHQKAMETYRAEVLSELRKKNTHKAEITAKTEENKQNANVPIQQSLF